MCYKIIKIHILNPLPHKLLIRHIIAIEYEKLPINPEYFNTYDINDQDILRVELIYNSNKNLLMNIQSLSLIETKPRKWEYFCYFDNKKGWIFFHSKQPLSKIKEISNTKINKLSSLFIEKPLLKFLAQIFERSEKTINFFKIFNLKNHLKNINKLDKKGGLSRISLYSSHNLGIFFSLDPKFLNQRIFIANIILKSRVLDYEPSLKDEIQEILEDNTYNLFDKLNINIYEYCSYEEIANRLKQELEDINNKKAKPRYFRIYRFIHFNLIENILTIDFLKCEKIPFEILKIYDIQNNKQTSISFKEESQPLKLLFHRKRVFKLTENKNVSALKIIYKIWSKIYVKYTK